MALANYSDLQTVVTDWMKRSNLSGKSADFITLAEGDIKTRFRGRNFKNSTTLTGTVGSRELGTTEGFPSDYKSIINLFLTTYGDEIRLTKLPHASFPYDNDNRPPDAYSIGPGKILLDSPCDTAHTFRMEYNQTLDLASNSTNWLMTNYPNVYVTGALHWASMYTYRGDAVKSLAWKQSFEEACAQVAWQDSVDDQAQLSVDPALTIPNATFNIQDGDL